MSATAHDADDSGPGARLGFKSKTVVQELGWDEDVDEDLRLAIEKQTGNELVDGEYGEILGAHVVGNRACDMIAELVDTIALEGGYQELARIIHAHPTISEAVLDAARAVDGWAIHQ